MTQREDAQGILDIGKHCFKCQRLDFLPFACEFCNHVYCSDHRTLELHNCPGQRPQRKVTPSPDSKDSREPVSSLFPDRKSDMKKVDELLKFPPKPTTIMEKQFRVGDAAKSTTNAFLKFARFLQKDRKSSKQPSLLSFKKKSKTADLIELKKAARGDPKVSPSDRIYVWVKLISSEETVAKKDALFVNKNWPAGRALDIVADLMKIKNLNNTTTQPDERLNMFVVAADGQPELVKPSERCTRLKMGDEVFLVKGSV